MIDLVFNTVRTILQAETGFLYGMGEMPESEASPPYGLIYGLPRLTPPGGMDSIADWIDIGVQIGCVGSTFEQAAAMQSKTQKVLLSSPLSFTYEEVTYSPAWLSLDRTIPPADDGHSLFRSNDEFSIRWETS